MPERCTKCFVLLDSDEVEIREYEQYFPRSQDWVYLNTQLITSAGNKEMVFQVDRNIYMLRNDAYLDSRPVVRFNNYMKVCGNEMSLSDTLYVLLKTEKDRYTEYVVKDISFLIDDGDVRKQTWRDGRELIRYVDGLAPGDSSEAVAGNVLHVGDVEEMECLSITNQRIFTGEGVRIMTYLEGIGPLYETREDRRETRLAKLNNQPISQVIAEACE